MGGKTIDYAYTSFLAEYMTDFICLKRGLGYKYNDEAYFLSRFDRYWAETGDGPLSLTYENMAPYLDRLSESQAIRLKIHQSAEPWKVNIIQNGCDK